MSRAAFADEALRACLGLQALGVRPGDVVAVQVPNRAELVISYYGAWLAGAVVVPITPLYGPSEMSFILRESGAKVRSAERRVGKGCGGTCRSRGGPDH